MVLYNSCGRRILKHTENFWWNENFDEGMLETTRARAEIGIRGKLNVL